MSIFEAVLQTYGILPPNARGAGIEKGRDSIKISDEAATTAQGVYTGEEKRFLALHARIIKMSAAERAKSRGTWAWRLFRRLPVVLQILVYIMAAAVMLLALPVVLYIMVQVFESKVACAKMLLLFLFCVLVLGLRVLLAKIV